MRQIVFLIFLEFNTIYNFDLIWKDMQNEYMQTIKFMEAYPDNFSTIFWKNCCNEVKKLILGKPDLKFLYYPRIAGTMVRMTFTDAQNLEESFLQDCISDTIREKISKFRDCNLLPLGSKLNYSVSTLGHVFYAARICDFYNDSPNKIIELGGGYGNLARVFSFLNSDIKYIIFDLPEILAIQYLFLRYTCPNLNVTICKSVTESFDKSGIYLVPVQLLNYIDLSCDCFISNFAITESNFNLQQRIAEKDFFYSKLCYITGQLNGSKESGWVSHKFLANNLRRVYKHVDFHPYYIFSANAKNFEAIALKE